MNLSQTLEMLQPCPCKLKVGDSVTVEGVNGIGTIIRRTGRLLAVRYRSGIVTKDQSIVHAASDAELTNKQVKLWRARERDADPNYAKEMRRRGIVDRNDNLHAEFGAPGESHGPNQIEPHSKGFVPSLKKKQSKPLTDDEEEALEEAIMPDKARERKKYRQGYNGKIGGLQTW
ncbi:MAG: hypothetical protein KGI50_06940 [Patescibacteria group bacterium]|nr:hypothetical protein [Patescibacteria group bacterium]MDE2439159.1 hypothetical protein [Patescibacteria group bacterium]